jgi:uncharacterized repeat protein (TIGR01451 family)
VKFLARGSGYTLFLTETGAVLRLRRTATEGAEAVPASGAADAAASWSTLRLRLEGANRSPKLTGFDELPGKSNYLVGGDARGWRTGVPSFAKVRYASVYPGIDVVYYGRQGQLEYDFVVAPGADPGRIRLKFEGARKTRVEENGDLVVSADGGDVRQQKPFAYQEINGTVREVASRYVVDRRGAVRVALGEYDRALPLVIDPVLIYSSYLGGSNSDLGLAIAVDSAGSAYVAGSTASTNFPGPSPLQDSKSDLLDAFVLKMSPDGRSLVYATYLGGNGEETATGIAVDSAGNAYLAGRTNSSSFPVTAGAFQETKDGRGDAFVAKLNPTGSGLLYATYLGGGGLDQAFSVAVDAAGAAYVVGRTDSFNFPGFPTVTRSGSPAFRSADGGASWEPSSDGMPAPAIFEFAAAPGASGEVYAATNLGVYKSTDGGASWQLTGQARTSTAPALARSVAVDPSNPNVIYVGTDGGFGIYKSTDGGMLYEAKGGLLQSNFVYSLAVDPSSPSTIYAGTLFGVHKSTNGGDTWAEMRVGIPGSSPVVTKVVIDPNNSQVIYLAASNRGVWKSTNGGANWTAVNNGLGLFGSTPQVRTIALDPSQPSTLYVAAPGFGGAVYKSTDGGANWTAASNGLSVMVGGRPFTPTINALLVDPAAPSNIYAGTDGFGVFRSTDGGANWEAVNVGLLTKTILALSPGTGGPGSLLAGASTGADAFVAKFNPAGANVEYLRLLGGSNHDEARGVAVGAGGSAYVAGTTSSEDFPTAAAVQPMYGGFTDAFVVRLNSSGDFIYSTYLGGDSTDRGGDVAVGPGGAAFVTGITQSNNFPIANALQPTIGANDAFPFTDAFVTKLAANGQTLAYSTYLGGNRNDEGLGIAVGADGSAYVAGLTDSSDFPEVDTAAQRGGGTDAFAVRLNPAGSALLFSTYFGGAGHDQANRIATDMAGGIYVVGTTASTDLPVMNAARGTFGGNTDGFIAKFGVEANLSVTVTESRDPVMVNNPLSYTLRVSNAGPSVATGVTLTHTLPAGMTFVSATPTQGTCGASGQVVTCDLGGLPVSGVASVVVAVNPTTAGTFSTTVQVSAAEHDNNPSNNSVVETTKVSAAPSIAGRVTAAGGGGMSGVTLTLSGTQSATTQTDAGGFYQFAELTAGGNYVVTPSKENISFDPQSRAFNNLAADQAANFVGTTCTWTLSPANLSIGASGGPATVTVNTLPGCPWTAASNSDWVTITSAASGVGTGTVSFTVAPTAEPRAGRLTVAGRNFAVYQEAGSCNAFGFTSADYNLSDSPTLIEAADLNGDGFTDLMLANSGSSGFDIGASVMINDGAGGFTTGSFRTGLSVPRGFTLGDFNGDARPDAAMWEFAAAHVRILFNNGGGGFGQSATNVQLDAVPDSHSRAVIAADINRDGKGDLLVSTPSTNNIRVLLGDGAGGFTAAAPVGTRAGGNVDYTLLSVRDVNADGKPDLMLRPAHALFARISVRLGDGAGGFGPDIFSETPDAVTELQTGDFDGDARLDIVFPASICVTFNGPCTRAVIVMIGDGAGGFTFRSRVDDTQASSLAVADFDRDAKLDVAVTQTGRKLLLFKGDGAGGLGNPTPLSTGPETPFRGVGGVVAADFNRDGKPDLAVSDYTVGASVLTNRCAAPSISGRVIDANSSLGLAGVTISVTGTQSATTQTDAGGNYFVGGLAAGGSYVVVPSREFYRFSPASVTVSGLTGGQTADFAATAMTVRLARNHHLMEEGAGSFAVEVRRTGDASGAATVNYTTEGGTASERSDYTFSGGTLRFAPGEASKSFTVLVTDDYAVEGFESFTIKLSDPSGALLGSPATALVEIRDNDTTPTTLNPLDDSTFFVRQHYNDFLSRAGEEEGVRFWTNTIEECGADEQCREVRRINVSAAFFLSIEFQETGYLAYRTYKTAYGDTTSPNVDISVPAIRLREFLSDAQAIGQGVQVGVGDWEGRLEANKNAYVREFVTRPRFLAALPATLTPAEFVDALNRNAGGVLSPEERGQLIAEVAAASDPVQGRASALRKVAEDADLRQREKTRAFVLMQYYGYMRRNPDDPQDRDFSGWAFWLKKLDEFEGNFVQAEMVKAFIVSIEYRNRFRQ